MITRSRSRKGKMGDLADLRVIVNEIRRDMATNAKVMELITRIEERDAKISALEERIAVLETKNELLSRRIDDNESYNRRKNLRIVGIPPPADGVQETAADCLEKVKNAISTLDVDFDVHAVVDRAHRVSKKFKDAGGNVVQPMIVRFISWRSRTAVYKKRAKRGNVRFYTDLTKRRFELKKHAEKAVEGNEKVSYVFADINNNIGLKLSNNSFRFFNSEAELRSILQRL